MTNDEREVLIANLSLILQQQVSKNMSSRITEELATGLCHINKRGIGIVVTEAIVTTEEAEAKTEEEVTDDNTTSTTTKD